MSDQIRQPPAVTLSAQNLAFLPQGFVGIGTNAQSGGVPLQFQTPLVGQPVGMPLTTDMSRQAQKVREYEQQRSKLQHLNARGGKPANPDAMIAQMLGKPLAPNAPAGGGSAIRRPAPGDSATFMYSNQLNYPTSAPAYGNAFPQSIGPSVDVGYPGALNRPPMAPFIFSGGGPAVAHSTLQLTPKDLEKMMHHFAGIRLGNGKLPNAVGEMQQQQGYKSSGATDGVFVIPSVVSPSGHQVGATMANPSFFMPPWTRDKTKLPDEYTKYLGACLPPNRPYGVDLPDTGLVYMLLRSSGLSNEILGTIWALTNRSQPGQLTKEEFFVALALVALAQETGSVASWEVLSSIQIPPVPRLLLSNVSPIPQVSTSRPGGVPSMIPVAQTSIDQHLSNGIVISNAPPQPDPFQASSTAAADDFGEFTDFQASVCVTTVTASSFTVDKTSSTTSQDPYGALRALAPAESPPSGPATRDNPSTIFATVQAVDSAKPTASNDDSFGDFTTAMPQTCSADWSAPRKDPISLPSANFGGGPVARSRTEPKIAPGFTVDGQKKDLDQLLRQTYESLELGPGTCAKSDDDSASIRSESKEPSVHSLDLNSIKHFDLEQPECGDAENTRSQVSETHVMRSPAGSISLVDRYAAFRENGEQNGESATVEKHVDAWTKCLEACLQLLKQAENIFSRAEDGGVCKEILATERGSKYLCGNVQIYRVSKRIRLSLQTMAFQTDKFIDLLTDIDAAWTKLCEYVAFSGLLPTPENLDFRKAMVPLAGLSDETRKMACCGVCLLNVDATCKTDHGTNFDYKLTYGGRQYHAQCANLWINCIDSVLPALDVPCLL